MINDYTIFDNSMNGIKTLSDGISIIENGIITSNTAHINTINGSIGNFSNLTSQELTNHNNDILSNISRITALESVDNEARLITLETTQNELIDDFIENTQDIGTNIINIASNVTNISKNASDIAQNTSNININFADIADNKIKIFNNTNDIITNASDIEGIETLISPLLIGDFAFDIIVLDITQDNNSIIQTGVTSNILHKTTISELIVLDSIILPPYIEIIGSNHSDIMEFDSSGYILQDIATPNINTNIFRNSYFTNILVGGIIQDSGTTSLKKLFVEDIILNWGLNSFYITDNINDPMNNNYFRIQHFTNNTTYFDSSGNIHFRNKDRTLTNMDLNQDGELNVRSNLIVPQINSGSIRTNYVILPPNINAVYISTNSNTPGDGQYYRMRMEGDGRVFINSTGTIVFRSSANATNFSIFQSGNVTIRGNIDSPTINNLQSQIDDIDTLTTSLQTQIDNIVASESVETISIGSVTTSEPSTDATIINVGTSTDIILNFSIPRGNQGLQGDQGGQGSTGSKGERGSRGATGSRGSNGSDGNSLVATAAAVSAAGSAGVASGAAAASAASAAAAVSTASAALGLSQANLARIQALEVEVTTLNLLVDLHTSQITALTSVDNTQQAQILDLQILTDEQQETIILQQEQLTAQQTQINGIILINDTQQIEIDELQTQVNTFGFSSRSNNNYVSQF
jgi:hypothetical protein